VEHPPSPPTSRSNTQHRLKLRMLDAVPSDSRRDARVVRLMLPRQRQRVASRRRGLSQVPRGTPVALAPGPLWPACHPTPWMVSSPLSGGAADVATSVMTSSGTSAQSGSGHTVPPEFAGGPVQAAHHGPLALPSLTRNKPREVMPRGESSGVPTSCKTWKGSRGRPRIVAQALYRHRLTTQLTTLENDPISHPCRLTVAYSGQLVTGSHCACAGLG